MLMPRAGIEVLTDRWIIRAARGASLVDLQCEPERLLRLGFDSGLTLRVDGTWKATQGSPVTGVRIAKIDEVHHLGAGILSLVLFESGAMRLVLSDGLTIVARAADQAHISSGLPNVFEWTATDEGVTHWHAELDQ